jgi:hypothetical protein
MSKIFISYRRKGSEDIALRLYNTLAGRYGADRVFLDKRTISYGDDFVQSITSELQNCQFQLILIGADWAGREESHLRINDPRGHGALRARGSA